MILAIETSTPQGSVAMVATEGQIAAQGEIVFNETFHAGRSHSSQLFGVLERALGLHPLAGVRQIVVGLGPGSYAGVRIAISAAIGLSVATGGTRITEAPGITRSAGVQLLGIPSIVALGEAEYIALGDARRESYYFARVQEGRCLDGPRLVGVEELSAALEVWGALPRYASDELPSVPGVEMRHPAASALALSAARGIGITAQGVLEPIYLREPYITTPRKR